jgi:aryl-alcohol dehydrogenase-like predicted oxidoreductase
MTVAATEARPPRLALGTVQFGLRYGLAAGCPIPRPEVRSILEYAWDNGVDMLDTAAVYGNAESVIGEERPTRARFAIVSKTAPLQSDAHVDGGHVAEAVRASLARLRVPCLDALLVHHADDLMGEGGGRLFRALERLRVEGAVQRIGVSVYDPQTLLAVLDAFPLTVAQIPLNVLDQRFAKDGLLERLTERGVEIHVRSVFLQGVLISDPARLPCRFAPLHETLGRYRTAVAEAGLSPVAAAMRFVIGCPGVSAIVIGVDNLDNLRQNIGSYREAIACREAPRFDSFAFDEPNLIDPRRWGS